MDENLSGDVWLLSGTATAGDVDIARARLGSVTDDLQKLARERTRMAIQIRGSFARLGPAIVAESTVR